MTWIVGLLMICTAGAAAFAVAASTWERRAFNLVLTVIGTYTLGAVCGRFLP